MGWVSDKCTYIDLLVHGVCEYDVDLLVEAAAGPYSGVPNKRDGKTCQIRAMKASGVKYFDKSIESNFPCNPERNFCIS